MAYEHGRTNHPGLGRVPGTNLPPAGSPTARRRGSRTGLASRHRPGFRVRSRGAGANRLGAGWAGASGEARLASERAAALAGVVVRVAVRSVLVPAGVGSRP